MSETLSRKPIHEWLRYNYGPHVNKKTASVIDIYEQIIFAMTAMQWLERDIPGQSLMEAHTDTLKTAINSCIASGVFADMDAEDVDLVFHSMTGQQRYLAETLTPAEVTA